MRIIITTRFNEVFSVRLDQLAVGNLFTVLAIANDRVRVQALRIGFGEGATATVQAALPGGPIIISRGTTEFAVGRSVAMAMTVLPTAGRQG